MPKIVPRARPAQPSLEQAEAATELLRRRKARHNTIDFAQYVNPKYEAGAPHYKIAHELDLILRGENDRLMVFAPPRHGKTELGTRTLPALYLGHYPDRDVVAGSFDAKLADDFGRDVRNCVSTTAYKRLFPRVLLAEDSQAKGRWHTDSGGGFLSAGIGDQAGGGTGITGRGAHLLTIDDPFKDRGSADSFAKREHVWNWYKSTAYTRLMPGGAVVLIMTRWHEDDLAGRLIQEEANGGDQWRKLILSAVDEITGDPIEVWPERYNEAALHRIMMALGGPSSRDWLSLYGQRPGSQKGTLFKIEKIGVTDTMPIGTMVRAWDLAATKETGSRDPSWTAGVKLCKTSNEHFVVVHVVRFRGDPEDVEAAILNTAETDGHLVKIGLPQDPGQAGKSQVLNLTKRLIGYSVESSPESGDKATRASGIIAQSNVGNMELLSGPWNRNFLDELAGFPNGAHEDQVDALSRASSMLMSKGGVALWERLGSLPGARGM